MEKEVSLPESLENVKLAQLPPHIYYISNFISQEEEHELLRQLNAVPIPRWTQLSRRRLQTWPSALSKGNTLLSAPLPAWLFSPVVPRFETLNVFASSPHKAPNHVLINEYQAGQGILPHEDGSAYHPIVATISLSAPIVLDIYEKTDAGSRREQPQYRILQEERSLLITTSTMYAEALHGITETSVDQNINQDTIANWDLLGSKQKFKSGQFERETRVSLTYRDVLKTSKLGYGLKFLNKK